MPRRLDALAEWVRRRPWLRAGARLCVRLIPDVPWTRRFPELGPVRFRLRRHRWFLWEPLAKHDRFMLGVFDRLVHEGDVVYDVGANIGLYARMLVQWFGADRVLAFEPMAGNVELLRANVALGGLEERIGVFALAVGDRDGEEDLQVDDVRSSTAVLDRVSGGDPSAGRQHFHLPPLTERVRVARLDTLVADEALPPPSLIKIDTEGAEALVLDGARCTLATHRPRLIIATHGPDKAEQTLRVLEELGGGAWGFVREGGSCVYRRLSAADAARLANNNIVAAFDEAELREPLEPRSVEEVRRARSAG